VVLDYFNSDLIMQVVGISGDVLAEGLENRPGEIIYTAYPVLPSQRMVVVLRSAEDSVPAAEVIRRTVNEIDRNIPVTNVVIMKDLISESIADRRTMTIIMTVYAVIPLFLAAVGLYGLLVFVVRQRFREIGVRITLGATPGTIVSMILRQGLWLVSQGLIVGGAAALWATGQLRNQLFQVAPTDPITFIGVGIVVTFVTLAACLIPTLQAIRVDPNEALRV
jgi:ABC-type antimicrobial peptide transport system permease subunit